MVQVAPCALQVSIGHGTSSPVEQISAHNAVSGLKLARPWVSEQGWVACVWPNSSKTAAESSGEKQLKSRWAMATLLWSHAVTLQGKLKDRPLMRFYNITRSKAYDGILWI